MSPRQTEENSVNLSNSQDATSDHEAYLEDSPQKFASETEQSPLTTNESKEAKSDRSAVKKYWCLIPMLAIVIAIAGVSYVRWRAAGREEATTTEISPLSVRTTKAVVEPIQNWISSEGTVRAVNYKHLAFEVEGDVTYLGKRSGRRLREGDFVTKGELLASVDDRELLADVSQTQAAITEAQQNRAAAAAQVAQAQAQLQQVRSQVRRAQAQVEKAQTSRNLAQTNLERYRLLFEEGVISESEFDSRVSTLQDREADVAAAQEQVRSAQAQVQAVQEQYKATQSAITTAEARLSQAEVALEGARLYAPFDGIVAYLNITEGEYYSPQIVTTQLGGDYQGILDRIPMLIIAPANYEVITDLAGSNGDKVKPDQTAFIAPEGDIQESLGISNMVNRVWSKVVGYHQRRSP